MATLVLGSVGAAAGSILGGPLGGALGRFAGAFTGRIIDNKLFSSSSYSHSSGPRLKDLQVQTSGYGMMIPIIFGTVRIAGNIIWTRPIKEIANVANHRRRVKGSRINHAHTEYSYFASFAVSICEGEISELNKIFVVNKELNLENYNIRIYRGTETQKPDTLIESFEGIDSTPAFRGQAYVVFEDLPLFEFGNYIPNFVFEVTRKVFASDEPTLANTVSSVVMIPGGGEYVYDTVTQYKSFGNKINNKWCNLGKPESINHHTSSSKTNAVVATLDLKETLPKVKWVAVVVNWFGTSLDIAKCSILPGVEYNDKTAYNHPDLWYVENFSRSNAHKISQTDGRANYGGTINDASLIRYVKYLKSLNYKVMLYPMIFMDLVGKPWRGLISGEYDEVENFFNKRDGYNRFITHYCNLLKDDVDAFIIGSEMKSITSIKNDNNHFTAVSQLVALAGQCRKILGKNTIITYAADWSEYHHADGGWFHMDELWSSDNIDVIGIDAYFPLSNTKQSLYDIKEIQNGWLTGEGYDFYYTDETRKTYKKLENKYAWKTLDGGGKISTLIQMELKLNGAPCLRKYGLLSTDLVQLIVQLISPIYFIIMITINVIRFIQRD